MNTSEREFLQRSWEQEESAAIVKDVATKGKYCNLAISFLAKRMNINLEQTKEYFHMEIDKYVHRLLTNGQVFRAEHILNNVDRSPMYVFYEFVINNGCDENDMDNIILNYLKKNDTNFSSEFIELKRYFQMFGLIENDKHLISKYCKKNKKISLEQFMNEDVAFRRSAIVELFFIKKSTFLAPALHKETVWTYLLDNKLFLFLNKWVDLLYRMVDNIDLVEQHNNLEKSFEDTLTWLFQRYQITDDMKSVLNNYELQDCFLNNLARIGIFIEKELDQVPRILQRIYETESWLTNGGVLKRIEFSKNLVDFILKNNYLHLLILDFVDAKAVEEASNKYPEHKDHIDLCLALKSLNAYDLGTISVEVSKHILNTDSEFHKNNPLVYLFELLLQHTDLSTISQSDSTMCILSKIPMLKCFLNKLTNPKSQYHDQCSNLNDMVEQFNKISLKQIQSEANNDNLDFSNKTLIQKYGQPQILGFVHYVKQCRSAYAVYIFAIEQLQNYSQISRCQVAHACSVVADLALANLANDELVMHSMAFIEMLGMNSSNIRAFHKCLRVVKEAIPNVKFNELSESDLLKIIKNSIECEKGSRSLDELRAFCTMYDTKMPYTLLSNYAQKGQWLQFTILATYFGYSLEEVLSMCKAEFYESLIGENIGIAIILPTPCSAYQRRESISYREHRKYIQHKNDANEMYTSVSSNETTTLSARLKPGSFLSPDSMTELFAILLQCSTDTPSNLTTEPPINIQLFKMLLQQNPIVISNNTKSINLLENAIKMKWPILAVLAAIHNSQNVYFCWFVWLVTSTNCYNVQTEPIDNFDEMTQAIIESSIRNGFVTTLHQSIKIFYPENKFAMFTEYLWQTRMLKFDNLTTTNLQAYVVAINQVEMNGNDNDSFIVANNLHFTISALALHFKHSFSSGEHKQLLLNSLCESGISDFINLIDFCTLKTILEILSFTTVELDIDRFLRYKYSDNEIKLEYERICELLMEQRQFKKSLQIADHLHLTMHNIIYENWIYEYELDPMLFDLAKCELEIEKYLLSPELVINFYVYVADKLHYENPKKYAVLKMILDIIKKHQLLSTECFNCDRIEYEMIISFLKNSVPIEELDVYNSEYFETIMVAEQNVLYKSFLELKEVAGVDEFTVSNKLSLKPNELRKLEDLIAKLLDDGDIVQALRIQSIFNLRPLDLHYLVFCMALAEGLATLYQLTTEQRQMLSDGIRTGASRFTRRTLQARFNQSGSPNSSPIKLIISTNTTSATDQNDVPMNAEFEEIPSRDKQDVLDALQSLASKINHGTKIANRIVMIWRASMYLDKEYLDVLKTKDPYILLESAIHEDCIDKLVVLSDIMTSMELTNKEIADFLAANIATSIIKSQFYLLQNNANVSITSGQLQSLWGYDLDKEFRLFLELCPNTSLLGNCLLKYCDALKVYRKYDDAKMPNPDVDEETAIQVIFEKLKVIMDRKLLSHKKQNTITVELLIKAHECFVHDCYMEGIAMVLQRTKVLNSVLANAKSWRLIVKMLMGIGRYREMYYCFETLIQNEQFESLLGQFEDEACHGLKQAIISYLHENHPEDTENYRLAALHFMMYQEIAQMWESEAKQIITNLMSDQKIEINEASNTKESESPTITLFHLNCSYTVATLLTSAMNGYAHAAENYLLDNKLNLAQQSANMAELIALQINLVNRVNETNAFNVNAGANSLAGTCVCVLDIPSAMVMRHVIVNTLNVSHALILSHVYSYEINWTEAIFNQYVLLGNDKYLWDYCERMELTDGMIEVLVKNFQNQSNVTQKQETSLSSLIEMVESVTVRYKLASLLGLKRIVANLINDHSLYYLKDTNYGRNEMCDK